MHTPALLLSAAALVPMTAHAAVLVNSGLDGTATSDISNSAAKAVGFALGTTTALGVNSYSLTDIQVRLQTNNVASANANTVFALYSSTTTGDRRPSTLITTFSDPVFTGTAAANYTLTPDSPVTLQPQTTYWVVGYNTGAANNLQWLVSGPAATTTADGITVGSGTGSFPAGWVGSNFTTTVSWSKSSFYNDLVVNAVVPEPVLASWLAIGGLMGMRRRR
jgi:hypothetical protein